ncbi:MAG: type II toxin-antitoxin system RelE/ParE family toxin [Phycisphaerales bacterium]|nr:type II toxin-antitoxin system RelE/ParE family toxin [Phycisphaerales bacterium]
MTLHVSVAPAAAFDIADATTAYEATRPGLGREFLHELRRARVQIERFPAGSQQVLPGVRRCLIRRFPFGVFYRPLPDRIEIVAVLPTQADPFRLAVRAEAARSQ